MDEFLLYMNPHWQEGFFYPYEKERELLKKLKKENPLITLIIGPRRVGKTVILKQLINHWIQQGVERKRILYLLLENKHVSIKESVLNWSKWFGIDLQKPTYVLVDEVQYRENWTEEIKLLYDIFPNMKIYLTGSSSLLIRQDMGMLAGRIKSYFLKPLSFQEWLRFSSLPLPEEKELIWSLYQRYLYEQLPELLTYEDKVSYVKSLIDKVIEGDLRKLFGVVDKELAEALLRIIYKQPGQILDYKELADDLGVNRETISRYLKALEQGFLIKKLYSFSGSPLKSERKKKKFYPFYTTLLHYVSPLYPPLGPLLESDVVEKLDAEFYFYHRGKEIDVVLPHCNRAIEIKTSRRITCQSLSTLIQSPFEKYVVIPPTSQLQCSQVKEVYPWEVTQLRC